MNTMERLEEMLMKVKGLETLSDTYWYKYEGEVVEDPTIDATFNTFKISAHSEFSGDKQRYVVTAWNIRADLHAIELLYTDDQWFCVGEIYNYVGDKYNGWYVAFVKGPMWKRMHEFIHHELNAIKVDRKTFTRLSLGKPFTEIVLGM